jgi:putative tricarboxylic transport membrane protein
MGTTDRIAGFALLVLAGLVALDTRGLPVGTAHGPGPGYVPLLLALLMAAFGIALMIWGGGMPLGRLEWAEAGHAAAILGATAFTAVAMDRLGYRITMALFLLFLYGAVQRRRLLAALALAAALAAGSHWLFDVALRVPLPRGPLGL